MKKVLIAHQSTIPHYRVPFYNALERLRPANWRFEVVFDPTELHRPRFFKEPLDAAAFEFPILAVKTLTTQISGKRISYQTFWRKAAGYDLVIVEYAINNLTYPLCQLHQVTGTKFAYWGHDRDRMVENVSGFKLMTEKLKTVLTRQADGFLAYTPGVKRNLENQGLSPAKIFPLNNTIDINEQRAVFERWASQRENIKQELGLTDRKVLLFVGRFTPNKRIDFLLNALALLQEKVPEFHLLLVGSGGEAYLPEGLSNISYLGPITDLDKLGPVYAASDLFTFPGSVGLGPLQALCYDLPVMAIDATNHMPEFEYLSPANAVILPNTTTPAQYAQAILELFTDPAHLNRLKGNTWPSIQHLTLEAMAQNFIRGVDAILSS